MRDEEQNRPNESSSSTLNRRDFLGASLAAAPLFALTTGGRGLGGRADAQDEDDGGAQAPSPLHERRMLGDLGVSPIGLGCMSMSSGSYNPPRDKDEMIDVIRGAFDRGVTFYDTAEYYGPFTNEEIVGEALAPVRDQVVIATKFGFEFEGNEPVGRNSRPEHIRQTVDEMLQRLQTDYIDLLYCHRVDPDVPIEDVAGTVGDLIDEGKVRHFGLSETSPETTRRAHEVQPVAALQTEYSLVQRYPENQVLDTCEELGIGFVPWGPVCRGFLADKFNEYSRFSEDSRHDSVSYFSPEALEANYELLNLVREWARRKGVTPAQFSLAWLMAQKPFIVPIPGTTKIHHLEEDLGALDVTFTAAELEDFRSAIEGIELVGVDPPKAALTDG